MIFQKNLIYEENILAFNKDNIGAGSITPIQAQFYSGVIPLIFGNVESVTEIEEVITLFWYYTLNLLKFILLHKTLEETKFVMADSVVLNYTNTDLFAAHIQKNGKRNKLKLHIIVKLLMFSVLKIL